METLRKPDSVVESKCQTCSVLFLDDIPGAFLDKEPKKCSKNELAWWLKCRS
jgi:hypothetical protein